MLSHFLEGVAHFRLEVKRVLNHIPVFKVIHLLKLPVEAASSKIFVIRIVSNDAK